MTQRTQHNNSCSNVRKKVTYREQYLQDLQAQINVAARMLIKKKKKKKQKIQSIQASQSLIQNVKVSSQKLKPKKDNSHQSTQLLDTQLKLISKSSLSKYQEKSPKFRTKEPTLPNTASRPAPCNTPLATLVVSQKKFLKRSNRQSMQPPD